MMELCKNFSNLQPLSMRPRTQQRQWFAHDNRLIGGRRSPDLVLVNHYVGGSRTPDLPIIDWKDVVAICEIKYKDDPSLLEDAFQQLADKAYFVYNAQPDRSWFTGLLICGTKLYLTLLTRGGNFRFAPVDIYDNPEDFICLISFLSDSLDNRLGIDDHMWVVKPFNIGGAQIAWDDRPYMEALDGASTDIAAGKVKLLQVIGYLSLGTGM